MRFSGLPVFLLLKKLSKVSSIEKFDTSSVCLTFFLVCFFFSVTFYKKSQECLLICLYARHYFDLVSLTRC